MLKAVQLRFDAPLGTPAYHAQAALESYYPDAAAAAPIAVVLHREDGSSIYGDDVRNYTARDAFFTQFRSLLPLL